MIASELMTNVVTATLSMRAAAPVALYLALDDRRLTLLVWDACPALPAPRRRDDDAAGGRGLEIVQALSDRWGTCGIPGRGKVVWARFDLTGPPEWLPGLPRMILAAPGLRWHGDRKVGI